ncbi:MAG: VanZ family protein [Oscillospiraceae bacterium]|jgi:glycopeptide antibiotics resistance protein|nr:VanZ family protein [Oscillospiraceae bacterium]
MRITTAIPLGAAALIAALLSAIIHRKSGRAYALRVFFARFLGLWYALVALVVLFKLETIGLSLKWPSSLFTGNYVPLKTITQYLRQRNLVQLGGNLAVMFPLPILLYLNFPQAGYKNCLWLSLLVTALVEPLQLFINLALNIRTNIVDIDDFLLNAAGCLLGLLALRLFLSLRRPSP